MTASVTTLMGRGRCFRRFRRGVAAALLAAGLGAGPFGGAAVAQAPFAGGWTLNAENSTLAFQSVKNQTKVESSTFATYSGSIAEDGTARIEVQLDSVDTKVDLRNVRMRFLFFETFKFPAAVVTLRLDPAALADLPQVRRKVLSLPFTLDLHGVQKELSAEVAAVLISPDLVAVSTLAPIPVSVEEFGLLPGLQKLEEAAQVQIIPSGSVTFDFLFARNGTATAPADGGAAAPVAVAAAAGTGAAAALETQGDFSAEECIGRFEILSRTRSIYFRTASAALDAESNAFLDALHDIVNRCPAMRIEVGGHTDSDGSDAANQRLSERRAEAVARYLVAKGIPAERLVVRGYGEAVPVADNASAEGKAKNRRIEFRVLG